MANKCSRLVPASLMRILDLRKNTNLRGAHQDQDHLLTHLAQLAMADFTSQGQTHFG